MGHDIIAGELPDEQLTKLRETLEGIQSYTPEQWEHRLDDCSEPPFAAHLRRSAYDQYNKVIYRALNAEDVYGGCSGISEVKSYNREQIQVALQLLPSLVVDSPPPIDTELVDTLENILANVPRPPGWSSEAVKEQLPDIKWEVEFLEDILEWLDREEQKRVKIYFG